MQMRAVGWCAGELLLIYVVPVRVEVKFKHTRSLEIWPGNQPPVTDFRKLQ